MNFEIIDTENIKSINKDYLKMTYSKENKLNTIYSYDFDHKKVNKLKLNKDVYKRKYLFEEFIDLNVFCRYKKVLLVKYNVDKIVLILKRLEYNYNEETNKVKEYIYYDNLFVNTENELIHMVNFKENYYFTNEEVNNYKEYKHSIKINLLNGDYISDFIEKPNYYFDRNKMVSKRSLKNKFKFSKINMYLSKNKTRPYSGQIIHEKDFLLNGSEKNINYNDLFSKSILFKNYLINHFDLPNYFSKHNNLYEFFHHMIYPSLETTWIRFNKKELDNVSFYNLLFDGDEELDSLVNFKPIEEDKSQIFREHSFDLIKNKSLLFKKRTNQLLKEKILFFDKEDNPNKRDYLHLEFNLLPFILFKNQDNLNKYIMNIPPVHLNRKKATLDSLESDIIIKRKIIDSSDKRNYVTDYDEYEYKISRREILYLFSNRFSDYSVLENYLIKTATKRDYFDDFHLYDLLQILFNIVYKYDYKQLKEDDRNIVEEFLTNKYTNIEHFERDLYTCDALLKRDSLKDILPINKKIKLNSINDGYFFKQPETVFELKLVGEMMQHCVFSYLDSVKYKKRNVEIIVLYKKNEKNIETYPVVCLELRKTKEDYECVQAKCKRNERLFHNEELENIVIHFLIENGIKINTSDISRNDIN